MCQRIGGTESTRVCMESPIDRIANRANEFT